MADRPAVGGDHVGGLSRRAVVVGAAGGLATLAGCATGAAAPGNRTTSTAATTPTNTPTTPLQVEPAKAAVGDRVTVGASGLPPNTGLVLEWERVTGAWAIQQHSTVVGAEFTSSFERRGTARTDGSGAVETTLVVPEDHGGKHTVRLTAGGSVLSTGQVTVTPTFTLDRTSVPLGESLTVSVTGMPSSKYRRDDQVLWDDRFTGLVTGVTNRGTVRATVPAAGPPGRHVLEIGGGYEGATYLNPQQSPYPRPFRYANWTVTVTPATGTAGDSWARPTVSETPIEAFYPAIDAPTGQLSVTPTSGVVGSSATIQGSGLPANASVDLSWVTMTGSRVSNSGFTSVSKPLATVETDAHGAFSEPLAVPDDLGGTHPIVASVGGTSHAVTGFVIQPSIVDFGPASGPVGTPIDVHLKGVGWTEYDNIYAVTYDDDYVGYGCGFNTQGDVQMQFRAAGEPGLHVINCFPALYKKPEESRVVDVYTKPQLTYLDDHPVRPLPELGFLFEVT